MIRGLPTISPSIGRYIWDLFLVLAARMSFPHIKQRSLCDKLDYFVLALFQAETKGSSVCQGDDERASAPTVIAYGSDAKNIVIVSSPVHGYVCGDGR